MKIMYLFGILIIGLSFGFLLKNPIIYSNISGYNGLMIGQSKLKDIESTYGLKHKITKRTLSVRFRNKGSETITFYKVDYSKKGISFMIFSDDVNEGTISDILFTFPFDGFTEKNISIGKSNFGDVIRNYGEGYWNSGGIFYSRKLSLSYDKITFKTDKILSEEEMKNIDTNYVSKLKITEIELSRDIQNE